MTATTVDRILPLPAAPEAAGDVSGDLEALFGLDTRSLPVPDITASNTTTDCTDNGCSGTCPSVGCTPGCK